MTDGAGQDRFGFAVVSRRRWLRWTLGGALAIAGTAGGWRAFRGRAPRIDGLARLSAREFATLEALARALFPSGGTPAPGADELELARAFDRFLADEPPWNQADLTKALFLLEIGPLVFERRFTTFTRLASDDALVHLERVWVQGPSLLRRQVAFAFRKFMALVYYDSEPVWSGIGYPGPSFYVAARPAGS